MSLEHNFFISLISIKFKSIIYLSPSKFNCPFRPHLRFVSYLLQMGKRWYSDERLGTRDLGSRVRSPDILWSFVIIWYHRRVAKDNPNCCHTLLTELTMLYAFEALAAISLSSFSTYSRENVNIRGIIIKNLKTYAK